MVYFVYGTLITLVVVIAIDKISLKLYNLAPMAHAGLDDIAVLG